MAYYFSLDTARVVGAFVLQRGERSITFQNDNKDKTCGVVLECGASPGGASRYLVARVTSCDTRCTGFRILFFSAEPDSGLSNPDMTYTVNIMPQMTSDVIFDRRQLDGSVRYPALQPGTLKSRITGHGIRPENIRYMAFIFTGSNAVRLQNIRLTGRKPAKITQEQPTVDALGQWKIRKWEGKVRDAEQLTQLLGKESDTYKNEDFPDGWSRIGSDSTSKIAEGTGYFTVCRDDRNKWWFADPEGYAFYSNGCFGIYPGEPGWIYGNEEQFEKLRRGEKYREAWSYAEDSELYRRKFTGLFPKKTEMYSFGTANLITAFGGGWRSKWQTMTEKRCRSWGINSISMFSDPEFIRESGLPYVIMLERFPQTARCIWRGFPDVFSDEYRALCDDYAAQLEKYRDDRLLIGYFLNNEPLWAWENPAVITENLMESGVGMASHRRMLGFLKQKHGGDITALNGVWGTAFESFEAFEAPLTDMLRTYPGAEADMKEFALLMIHEYAGVASAAARRVDANHLNLGMRFAAYNRDFANATLDCFDVFSFNCYSRNPLTKLPPDNFEKPFMVTEFHMGAYDRGLPSASLIPVETQKDRAGLYVSYMNAVLSHPNCVGTHWFAWNDQPVWGRYDGENYQFGFVDICNLPHEEFMRTVKTVNNSVYSIKRKTIPET